MTLSESPNNASMSFKTCRQLIHEDFRKVLTQQPHGKISEYLYILRYLITNNSFKFCFWFRLGSWSKGKKRVLPIYILSWTTALKMGGSNAGVPSIGNNCVLGPGSKILGSVTLGDNVFVGANAVVTHDMPSNSIVAGIPAKVISMNGLQSTELVRQHK